jgi:hypothetical protein
VQNVSNAPFSHLFAGAPPLPRIDPAHDDTCSADSDSRKAISYFLKRRRVFGKELSSRHREGAPSEDWENYVQLIS